MNQKQTLLYGSLLGLFGVALGAFGAHALKGILLQNGRVETYDLAVRYQFYHALALLIIGLLMEKLGATIKWASLLIFVGVVIFSGSLYLFALTNTTTFAIITPLGGVLMLLGWGSLCYSIVTKK
ncbi:MAG TPA: DUF423 domain-containing protein [Cyclobacteriaceae bacterium]|jgi:uncharacterized membrane protein YgdD (TMEM256/DUF423 family)|nr:DUF423 domain-containing protein [Cyclobacteriaceae bacterium]